MPLYPKNDGKRYVYPQEIWDAKKCEKLAKSVARDGLGTKYPFKGYVGNIIKTSTGITINGEWYPGVEYPLPQIAEGFSLVVRPTWGWQLVKN